MLELNNKVLLYNVFAEICIPKVKDGIQAAQEVDHWKTARDTVQEKKSMSPTIPMNFLCQFVNQDNNRPTDELYQSLDPFKSTDPELIIP